MLSRQRKLTVTQLPLVVSKGTRLGPNVREAPANESHGKVFLVILD